MPKWPCALLPVSLQCLRCYMEGTTLLSSRQLPIVDRAANGPLVDAEQLRGLPRRETIGHSSGEILAIPDPGFFLLTIGV